MVLAIVHWQTAANIRLRNGGHDNDETNDLFARSKNHYLYALSHFYELNSSCSVEDLQALGLILQHMRAFPKPGRSWLMARSAMAMCIELGLHRKSSNWRPDGPEPNCIEIEMRKRIFWCILTLEVSLAGKLGRPMSLREGDWDVDYPERVEDESITETGILNTSVPDECSIDVAIAMFKHTAITMKIHSTLYGAIRPSIDKYVSLVEDLERDLSTWREKCDYCKSLCPLLWDVQG